MKQGTENINIAAAPPSTKFFEAEEREGFLVTSMMKRYWAAQLRVLSEIDRVCKKHNIRWFAACGTLLGAVRHGGYIPWDDDMDICMLRHDWIRFFEVAKDELPKDYCVLALHLEKEYKQMIGRIVNAHAIEFGEEHMKEYFGCPYAVGIDIFPLDGLAEDEVEEEKRRSMLKDVQKAYHLVDSGKMDTPECKKVLDDIEKQNHTVLHRQGDLVRELLLLTEKLYMMYPSENARNLALMPFWVTHHDHKYRGELYKNAFLLPFEYTTISVPAGYNEVLGIDYGDYMPIQKGGGGHDYPVYKDQEEMLRKMNKGNPYRYTMTKADIQGFHREKTRKEKCLEMTKTLLQAHTQVENLALSENIELAGQILNECQSLAISLGTYMENQMPGCEHPVHMLEDYCEMVYEANASWNENSAGALSHAIRDIEAAIDSYFVSKKKEVLFLPCKAAWWHSMEKIYQKYCSMPDTEVYVMPLSYLDGDRLTGVNGGEHNERSFFPESMNLVAVEDYDIAAHHPDVIVTQYPYDEWGLTMDIPGFFYSKNLTAFTDKLVYVPCFEVDAPINEEDKAIAAIKVIIEQPAVLYADQIVVSSDSMKKLYVDTLVDISGIRDCWEDKVFVFNEPDLLTGQETVGTAKLPEEWHKKIGNRKIWIFGVNGAFLVENGHHAVTKLKDVMSQIEDAAEDIVCLYAPSRDLDQVKEFDADLWRDYAGFVESIKDKECVIYDYEHDADKYIHFVSGYYGAAGNLAHKCRNMGKPVTLMSMP